MSWLALLASGLACALGLGTVLLAGPDATNRMRDDAFYEFTWAANLAMGHGPTVSDGAFTSGVQLLWSLCLVPFVWLCGAAALPLLAPWLGFLLHAATAVLWWKSSRCHLTGLCLALCWLGHPLLLQECQNGQETALACALATCLWVGRAARERTFFVVSLLAVLARSDLAMAVLLLSLWRHRRRPVHALWVPGGVVGVHLATNLLLGGGLMQDSALPMAWLWHANRALVDPHGEHFWGQVWWFLRPVFLGGPFALVSSMGLGYCVFLFLRPYWPLALRALPAVAVGCACASGAQDLTTAAWAALLLALLPAPGRRTVPLPLLALALGLFAIVFVHWGLRWYPRNYYVAPLAVAAFAAIARHGRCRLLLLAFAAAQIADHGRVEPEPLAGQIEMEMAGRYLSEVLPAGERVGCFNSGLVSFHAAVLADAPSRHGVVNLDGVIDARAFAALRRGQLASWLDDQGIRFVLDGPRQFLRAPQLPHACGVWFGPDFEPARDLVEVARFMAPDFGDRPLGDGMRLYWRRGRGEAPPRFAASRDLGLGLDGARYVRWAAGAGETLEREAADGTRRPLRTADVETAMVLRLHGAARAACRLFVAGKSTPVLELLPL